MCAKISVRGGKCELDREHCSGRSVSIQTERGMDEEVDSSKLEHQVELAERVATKPPQNGLELLLRASERCCCKDW
jgi:hypothetical protein